MYCQKCGQYNDDNSNYCSNDGVFLLGNKNNVFMTKNEIKYCKYCGEKVESHSLYCSSCGQSLFHVDMKRTINKESKSKNQSIIKDKFKNIDFKHPLKVAGIAFIILLVVSVIISIVMNQKINSEILDILELDINIDNKFLNFIDYALLSHLLGATIKVTLSGYGCKILKFRGGLYLYILIPSIIFIVLGILRGRKDLKEERYFNPIDAALVGLYYGLGLLILSFCNFKKINIPIPYIRKHITIAKEYSFLGALFNGLMIALIFYLAGYGIYMLIKKENKRFFKYRYIFNGIFLLTLGYIISLIAYMIVFRGHIISADFIEFEDFDIVTILQYPAYLWSLINFNTFTSSGVYNLVNISLLKNVDILKEVLGKGRLIVLYLLTFIPFILFFFQGRKERGAGTGNLYLNLVYNSLTYSLLMTFFAVGSFMYMNVDNEMIISMGFKAVETFFSCFVFSYLISLSGAFLTKSGYKKEASDYNE